MHMSRSKLQEYVQTTMRYLNTDRGKIRWRSRVSYGYSPVHSLTAAVMVSCHIQKYENIAEVVKTLTKKNLTVVNG